MNQGGHPGGNLHGPPHHAGNIQTQNAHAQGLAAPPHGQVGDLETFPDEGKAIFDVQADLIDIGS